MLVLTEIAKLSPPPAPILACVVPAEFFKLKPADVVACTVLAFTLLPLILPDTERLVNVPTLVMLACAFEVTVAAVLAVAAEVAVPALVANLGRMWHWPQCLKH